MRLGNAVLEGVLALSDDGVLALDDDGRVVVWSRALERITDVRAVDVIGRRVAELAPTIGAMTEDIAEARRKVSIGRPAAFEGRRVGQRMIDARYSAVQGGGIVGVVRDATERRTLTERRREMEHRFETMANAAPVLLWMSGTDGMCTFFNQTWRDYTGRTTEQEWGIGWSEGVHFEDLQRCLDTYMDAFNERRPFEMEYRLRRADGAHRWILDRGVPRYTPDGTFAGYIGSCTDIDDLRSSEAELQRAVRSRDEFLSIASHELKTPLTSLLLLLESVLTAMKKREEEPLRKRVELATEQAVRLGKLIEDMLDISRITHDRLAFDLDEVDVAALTREVAARLAESAAAAGSELRLSVPEGPVIGQWDRMRVEQTVLNLVTNAIKFGNGAPIDVSVEATDALARVRVKDRGIGIPRADQERIFGRFERAVSTRHYGGLGLGLWIVRQIVQGLGGMIEVKSEAGEGSEFIVTLPR